MGFSLAGIPVNKSGVEAALEYIKSAAVEK
jgi:hypothetical protein